ncbi:MAG: hypothetical protein ACE366_24535 [Bradymonadia bacterium]
MSASFIIAGLLTGWSIGAGAGAGAVDGEAVGLFQPWIGVGDRSWGLAVQAPLRLEFDSGDLRSQDWDEATDAGRVLRFFTLTGDLGDTHYDLRAGGLTALTLGHGTLVDRYHNNTVDDHPRVGLALSLGGRRGSAQVFIDQVLAAPVAGGRASTTWGKWSTFGISFVADTGVRVPRSPGGPADDGFFAGYGADLTFHLQRTRALNLDLYVEGNGIDDAGAGLHTGLKGRWKARRKWALTLLGEYMYLSKDYTWSLFDTGYLIDARTPGRSRLGVRDGAASGGRGRVEIDYDGRLAVGVQYANAEGPDQADATAWLRVSTERLDVSAYVDHRAGPGPSESLGALGARYAIMPGLWVAGHLARAWRTSPGPEDDIPGGLRPRWEGGITIETAFETR